MMKSVGSVLSILGRNGKGAHPGERHAAVQRLADVFAKLIDKPAQGMKAAKAEPIKDAPLAIIRPQKPEEAQMPMPGLASEIALAAALPPAEQPAEAPKTAKPPRKAAKAEIEPAKPQPAASLPGEAVMLAAPSLAVMDQQPDTVSVSDPNPEKAPEPDLPVQPLPSVTEHPELPETIQDPAPSPSSGIVFAKQETHFDTARFAWTMTGAALPAIAPEIGAAPPQRIIPATLPLDAPPSREPLKTLTLEIDPGPERDAVTATLKLRQDQLEVRLETGDKDMAMRLKDAASVLTQSLEQGGYRVETVVVQKTGAADSAALFQAMTQQDRSGRPRTRTEREERTGHERTNGLRRARAGGDLIV